MPYEPPDPSSRTERPGYGNYSSMGAGTQSPEVKAPRRLGISDLLNGPGTGTSHDGYSGYSESRYAPGPQVPSRSSQGYGTSRTGYPAPASTYFPAQIAPYRELSNQLGSRNTPVPSYGVYRPSPYYGNTVGFSPKLRNAFGGITQRVSYQDNIPRNPSLTTPSPQSSQPRAVNVVSFEESNAIYKFLELGQHAKSRDLLSNIQKRAGIPRREILLQAQFSNGRNLVHVAVRLSGKDNGQFLQQSQGIFNFLDMEGVFNGQSDCLRFINHNPRRQLSDQANRGDIFPLEKSPLLMACLRGYPTEMIDALVNRGANVRDRTVDRGWTPVHCAAANTAGDAEGARIIKYFATLLPRGNLAKRDFMAPAIRHNLNTPAHLAANVSLFDPRPDVEPVRQGTFEALKNVTDWDCVAVNNGDGVQPGGKATESQKARYKEILEEELALQIERAENRASRKLESGKASKSRVSKVDRGGRRR